MIVVLMVLEENSVRKWDAPVMRLPVLATDNVMPEPENVAVIQVGPESVVTSLNVTMTVAVPERVNLSIHRPVNVARNTSRVIVEVTATREMLQ